jgi:hypothetical protein
VCGFLWGFASGFLLGVVGVTTGAVSLGVVGVTAGVVSVGVVGVTAGVVFVVVFEPPFFLPFRESVGALLIVEAT